MEYKGWISNGLANCEREFEFEIDDEDLKNMSVEDIEGYASEAMHNEIEWGFEPTKQPKPEHEDIKKYGYFLQYSPSKNKWYAAYDANKGSVWFIWGGKDFKQISRNILPNDLE